MAWAMNTGTSPKCGPFSRNTRLTPISCSRHTSSPSRAASWPRDFEAPLAIWQDHFGKEPFVEITDELPALRDVVHRNVVRITVRKAADMRVPTVIVLAAIDNLVKGAAGQAVQNANVSFGLSEVAGLPR